MRILPAFLFIAVALAGCSGSDAPDDGSDLATGKGAVAGLLLDDRFRPIDLEDDPQGDFQAEGFILLQETGEQVQSDQNGEFTFDDLEPGQYTLRASIEDHEAVPQKVSVAAGEFAEAQLVARRTASAGGFIISHEYAAFVPCGANVIVYGDSFDCTGDQSGDSARVKFTTDYSSYDARHLVMEMQSNQQQYFDVWLQPVENQVCSGAYQIMGGPETDYLRFQLDLGESAISSDTASGADCETLPWENDQPVQTYVYMNSLGFDEGVGFGVGVYYGIQANFVQNVFVGPPDVDVDAYCVLC